VHCAAALLRSGHLAARVAFNHRTNALAIENARNHGVGTSEVIAGVRSATTAGPLRSK